MKKSGLPKKVPSQKAKTTPTGQFAENEPSAIHVPSKAYLAALDAVGKMGMKKE